MLKSLKKQAKKQPKKQSNKDKPSKAEAKKPREQEQQDVGTDLVDINYNEKETTIKTVKKQQTSKLDEKEIDTSNIVIEKKEEKKAVTSWVVNESEVKNLLRKDFVMKEHEFEFQSLTDEKKNKELQELAKKEAEENKPKVTEVGGLKLAPLQNTDKGKQQELVFNKKTQTPSLIATIGTLPVKDVVFTNSSLSGNVNFAPLEKTAQQLKEQQLQQKMRKEPEIAVKGKAGWLGAKTNEVKAPEAEFKVSAWALKAQEAQGVQPGNFAPLQKTAQELRLQNARQEQDFKYSNKKDQQERRKVREAQETAVVKKLP